MAQSRREGVALALPFLALPFFFSEGEDLEGLPPPPSPGVRGASAIRLESALQRRRAAII